MPNALDRWEEKLQAALEAVDDKLEQHYHGAFPKLPNRPAYGKTASGAYDGLFTILAQYSPGFGSPSGEGYIVTLRLATRASVPEATREQITQNAIAWLQEELDHLFPPAGTLRIIHENGLYKIIGNLSLH